jgi:hypothetical protein
VGSQSTPEDVLAALKAASRPLSKSELLARTQGLRVHSLDLHLSRLLALSQIEELQRDQAAELGAVTYARSPTALYYRPYEEAHHCHFCGTYVTDGWEYRSGEPNVRHWLSDCRPDLVEHEPGELCTWHDLGPDSHGVVKTQDCYAYQDRDTRQWGDEHKHFDKDGPM